MNNPWMKLDPNDHSMSVAGAVARGSLGIVASASGFIASSLPQIEAWLRVTSLVVGIGVGLATIWSLTRKGRGSKEDPPHQS